MAMPVIVARRRERPARYEPSRRSLLVVSSISTFLLLFCWAQRIAAQVLETATEESVKAAYLYRFAEYVRWPPDVFENPTTPLTIGVVGSDLLVGELRAVTSERRVDGRPVGVRRLDATDSPDNVHILFVAAASMSELPRLCEAARGRSMLVVTESPGALQAGSVINFTPVDRRIRFEVSLLSADRCNVRLSSQLLVVAERVERGTP